jgi:hypothetical protein
MSVINIEGMEILIFSGTHKFAVNYLVKLFDTLPITRITTTYDKLYNTSIMIKNRLFNDTKCQIHSPRLVLD